VCLEKQNQKALLPFLRKPERKSHKTRKSRHKQSIQLSLKSEVHHNKPPQPSEPILFPKLRIYFADFPYPPCSIGTRGWSPWRPDAVISTTWPLSWKRGRRSGKAFAFQWRKTLSHGFSRAVRGAPDRPKKSWSAFPSIQPSLQIIWFHGRFERAIKLAPDCSRNKKLVNKKRQLFQGPRPTILSPCSFSVAAVFFALTSRTKKQNLPQVQEY